MFLRKNTIAITVVLLLYIIFNRNTATEIVLGSDNINLDPKKYSDYYIDRVTTFKSLQSNKNQIVFLGDSLIDICEWDELFNNPLIKNRGISGDTTYGVLNRLDEIIEAKPKKVFIMLGINDIGKGRTTEAITTDYKKILSKIKDDSPGTEIYVHSVLPINKDIFKTSTKDEEIVNLNSALKSLCGKLQVKYIDLYSLFIVPGNKLNPKYTTGGIHINGSGYLVWKEEIKDFCK